MILLISFGLIIQVYWIFSQGSHEPAHHRATYLSKGVKFRTSPPCIINYINCMIPAIRINSGPALNSYLCSQRND